MADDDVIDIPNFLGTRTDPVRAIFEGARRQAAEQNARISAASARREWRESDKRAELPGWGSEEGEGE